MSSSKKLICSNIVEAETLKAKLLEEGIACSSYDESTNKAIVGAYLPGAVVLVKEEDYERAKAIQTADFQERDKSIPWCPMCGSENVVVEHALWLHPTESEVFHCEACNRRFRK